LMSPDDVDALALTLAVNPPRSDRMRGSSQVKIAEGVGSNPFDR